MVYVIKHMLNNQVFIAIKNIKKKHYILFIFIINNE